MAFLCLAQITGLPNRLRAMVISTAPSTGSPGRFPCEGAASLAAGSCRVLLFFLAAWVISRQPVHHWHPPYSNSRTVSSSSCFLRLAPLAPMIFSRFWKRVQSANTKNSRNGFAVFGRRRPGPCGQKTKARGGSFLRVPSFASSSHARSCRPELPPGPAARTCLPRNSEGCRPEQRLTAARAPGEPFRRPAGQLWHRGQ